MTWQQVARKDFEDAVRSKMLWGIIAVFVAFMGFVLAVAIGTTDTSEATGGAALALTAQLNQLFVPLVALVAGYMAVVGERRSGSLRVLLSYPHSRRDVVVGKLAGRSAVIAVTLVAGSLVTIAMVAVLVASPELADVAGLLGATVLFGVAFTGLAVGISAATGTRGKAMALAIGSLLVFLVVWDAAAAGVYAGITGSLPGLSVEPWYFLLKRLSPVGAFRTLAEGFIDGRLQPFFQMGLEQVPPDTPPSERTVEARVGGALPFYLSEWFAALTLAAWGLVPSVVGAFRLERSDL
jgi:ABC-2 type transport system permease protein